MLDQTMVFPIKGDADLAGVHIFFLKFTKVNRLVDIIHTVYTKNKVWTNESVGLKINPSFQYIYRQFFCHKLQDNSSEEWKHYYNVLMKLWLNQHHSVKWEVSPH